MRRDSGRRGREDDGEERGKNERKGGKGGTGAEMEGVVSREIETEMEKESGRRKRLEDGQEGGV
jgi:hypothetical protein